MNKYLEALIIKSEKTINMKIVIVEEKPLISKMLYGFISDLGYEVLCFNSVSDFNKSRSRGSGPVDLIFIDPEMPKGQGLGIIKEIHELNLEADVIIISDGNNMIDPRQAINNGVYSYLNKPVRLAELELLITRVQEKRSRKAWQPD